MIKTFSCLRIGPCKFINDMFHSLVSGSVISPTPLVVPSPLRQCPLLLLNWMQPTPGVNAVKFVRAKLAFNSNSNYQGIFQDLEHGGCQPTLGGPFTSPLPFPFPSLTLSPSFYTSLP